MNCQNCGTEITGGGNICPKCGAEVGAVAPPPAATPPPAPPAYSPAPAPRSGGSPVLSFILLLIGSLLLIGGVVGAVALFGGMKMSVMLPASSKALISALTIGALVAGFILIAVVGLGGKRIGLAVLTLLIAGAVFAAGLYPVLKPAPLAQNLPDDTIAFFSMDMFNLVGAQNHYLSVVGKDRTFKETQRLLKFFKIDLNLEEFIQGIAKRTRGWIGREVVISVGKNPDKEIAILIGARSGKKAEKAIPELIEYVKTTMSDAVKSADKDSAKAIKETKVEFVESKFKGITEYCLKPEKGASPKADTICWAAGKKALVLSPSKKYLETILTNMESKPTEKQRMFAQLSRSKAPGKRVYYLYVDAASIFSLLELDKEIKKDKELAKYAKDIKSVKGAELSVSYVGLNMEMSVALLLDDKAVGDTAIVKKIVEFKGEKPEMDAYINTDQTMAYFSVSHVHDLLQLLYDELLKKEMKDMKKEMGVTPEEFLDAIGDEIGVSLIDLKINMSDKKNPVAVKLVAAMQMNPKAKDAKGTLMTMLKKAFPAKGSTKLVDKGGDVYEVKDKDMPPGIQPSIGFSKELLYITSDSATMNEFKGKKNGKSLKSTSVVKLMVNPSRFKGLMNTAFEEMAKETSSKKLGKSDSMIVDLLMALLDVYGAGTLSLDIQKDRISLSYLQVINEKPLHDFPLEKAVDTIIAAAKGEGGESVLNNFGKAKNKANFMACQQQLSTIKTGVEAHLSESGDLSGIDNVEKICHLILPGYSSASDCESLGLVSQRVNEVCMPGTLNFLANAENFQYEISAMPQGGNGCCICITETATTPEQGAQCDPMAGCNCVH